MLPLEQELTSITDFKKTPSNKKLRSRACDTISKNVFFTFPGMRRRSRRKKALKDINRN